LRFGVISFERDLVVAVRILDGAKVAHRQGDALGHVANGQLTADVELVVAARGGGRALEGQLWELLAVGLAPG